MQKDASEDTRMLNFIIKMSGVNSQIKLLEFPSGQWECSWRPRSGDATLLNSGEARADSARGAIAGAMVRVPRQEKARELLEG